MRRLAAACLSALLACAPPAFAGKADDTLNVGFRLQLQSLDVYYSPGREGFLLGFWLYDALVFRDAETMQFRPALATAWRQVDDLTLEFDIRQGVKFHDGSTMTADDVVHTLSFAADPANRVFNRSSTAWIASVEKTGPWTVRIRGSSVMPIALEELAKLPIYPAAYYSQVGREGMGRRPIGTGPWRGEVGPGGTVVFTRFDDHYAESPKGRPAIRRMVYRTIPDVNTQVAELMTGGLDWAYYIPDDQAERLRRVPTLRVVNAETFRVAFLTMDAAGLTNPQTPLRDLRVRQAIAHAIDRETLTRSLVGGSARVIHSACYPPQFGCTEEVRRYPFDLARARALMAEAGQSGGFELDIYAYRSRPVAEAIINYLRAIGIRANLRWLQYPAVIQKRRENEAPLVVDDWGSGSVNDVAAFLPFFFTGTGEDQARDAELTAAVNRGGATNDPEARRAAYAEALRRIADQAYWVPLFTMPVNYVHGANLEIPITADEIPQFWRARWR